MTDQNCDRTQPPWKREPVFKSGNMDNCVKVQHVLFHVIITNNTLHARCRQATTEAPDLVTKKTTQRNLLCKNRIIPAQLATIYVYKREAPQCAPLRSLALFNRDHWS